MERLSEAEPKKLGDTAGGRAIMKLAFSMPMVLVMGSAAFSLPGSAPAELLRWLGTFTLGILAGLLSLAIVERAHGWLTH